MEDFNLQSYNSRSYNDKTRVVLQKTAPQEIKDKMNNACNPKKSDATYETDSETFENKLRALFKEYGIQDDVDNLISYILDNLDCKADVILNKIYKLIELTLKNNYDKKSNKIDINKFSKNIQKYRIATKNGWDIEEYDINRKQYENFNIKDSILSLYKSEHKGQDCKIEDLTEEELQEYALKLLNKDLISNNDKTTNDESELDIIRKKYILLLTNVSDEDKYLLKPILDKIIAAQADLEEKDDILSDTLSTFSDENIKKDFAHKFTNDDLAKASEMDKLATIGTWSIECRYDKLENLEKISQNKKEIDKYTELAACYSVVIIADKNISEAEREQFVEKINSFAKQNLDYQKFLENLSHCEDLISKNPTSFNTTAEDFRKFIDKVSNNEYSQKFPEKSAFDTETSTFKTTEEKIIAEANEKIEIIKADIAKNNLDNSQPQKFVIEPQEFVVEPQKEEEPSEESYLSFNLKNFTGSLNFKIIKNIVKSSQDISKAIEQATIKEYKIMGKAQQGDLLQISTNDFFNELVENTKTSTLALLLAIGWKGRTVDNTQKVKEIVEESKNDVA